MTSSFGKRKHVYTVHLPEKFICSVLSAVCCGARSTLGLCRLADPVAGQGGGHQVSRAQPSLGPAPLHAQHHSQTEASELSIPGLCGL